MSGSQSTAVRGTDDLVCSSLGFVVQLARAYRNSGVPMEDLVSEGNLGLLEAARRYDPGRETKFITYASWWIRKAILQAVHGQSRLIAIPAYQRRKDPAVRFHPRETSLDAPAGKRSTGTLLEVLADDRSLHPERLALDREWRRILEEGLRRLSSQELAVLVRRFGLDGRPCLTLKEAGNEMGLSRERVRQIEQAATRRLRRLILRRTAPVTPSRRKRAVG